MRLACTAILRAWNSSSVGAWWRPHRCHQYAPGLYEWPSALLNAGYKRGATIPRCVGADYEVVDFPVFCPVALAGLGSLPETILSRSIIIRMRRRAPHEQVESFRYRVEEPIAIPLKERLVAWAELVGPDAGDAWPELPDGLTDRPAEIWEPLIAIADAAGGEWPETAREAARTLHVVRESPPPAQYVANLIEWGGLVKARSGSAE